MNCNTNIENNTQKNVYLSDLLRRSHCINHTSVRKRTCRHPDLLSCPSPPTSSSPEVTGILMFVKITPLLFVLIVLLHTHESSNTIVLHISDLSMNGVYSKFVCIYVYVSGFFYSTQHYVCGLCTWTPFWGLLVMCAHFSFNPNHFESKLKTLLSTHLLELLSCVTTEYVIQKLNTGIIL